MLRACNVSHDAIDAAIDAFERAWRSGDAPHLLGFVDGAVKAEGRLALLHELVRVDLEYRWRSSGSMDRDRRTLDDYLPLLAELGRRDDLPIDLIAEEYRVRRRWGDLRDATELLQRYPERHAELKCALSQVDEEIEREVQPPTVASAVSNRRAAEAFEMAGIPQFDYHDFVLQAHIGSGGIGKVYRAWWKSRKAHVALKMLRKAWWRQPGADELFFREAAILLRLRHKHIVRMHGIGRTDKGGCFLVIDLIDGGDISQYLGKQLPLTTVLDWLSQAADALAYAHREGVVHRDVKPSNLLLGSSGEIHVADFGLALAPTARLDCAGEVVGTVAYMAPEQLFGKQGIGPAADIFSLGAVLHALLHGQPPWHGDLLSAVRQRLEQRLDMHVTSSAIAPSIQNIVSRCLAFDPKERFANGEELADALRAELARI